MVLKFFSNFSLLLILLTYNICLNQNECWSYKRRGKIKKHPVSPQHSKTLQVGPDIFIGTELFSCFLKKRHVVPLMQREAIEDRVEEFYKIIVDYRNRSKQQNEKLLKDWPVPFLHHIHVGELEGTRNILDGQHRFNALKRFYDEERNNNNIIDFNISFVIKKCGTLKDLKQYYRDLNNHFDSAELVLADNELDAQEAIKKFVREKFPSHVSLSLNPRFPNVNLDELTTFMIKNHGEQTEQGCSYKNIVEELIKLNKFIGLQLQEEHQALWAQANGKQGLYLAAILGHGIALKKDSRINKKLRGDCWTFYFGDSMKGCCQCCGEEINYKEKGFEVGHVISRHHGGTDEIENLKPICKKCNVRMSTTNLEEYQKIVYPGTVEEIKSRTKDIKDHSLASPIYKDIQIEVQ